MEFNEYQKQALQTVCYDDSIGPYYSVLGLCGEAGEVADKLKKIYRDKDWKNISSEDKSAIAKELGDVLWYIAKMSDELGFTLDGIARTNLAKINKRKETNTLHGQGDDREDFWKQIREAYERKPEVIAYREKQRTDLVDAVLNDPRLKELEEQNKMNKILSVNPTPKIELK